MMINQDLQSVVHELASEIIRDLTDDAANLNSFEFLSRFPFKFVDPEDSDKKKRILAAITSKHRAAAEKSVAAAFSDSAGLTVDGYLCEAVEDFLNYAIPRIAGLPDYEAVFDKLYQQFDESLFGTTCLVTVFAILCNVWDGDGTFLPEGFRLRYVGKDSATPAENRWSRDRVVPYIEISKTAHPIGRGRQIAQQSHHFILEYSATLQKSPDLIRDAYQLRDEITRKFILAVRLLKHTAVFADYRGFRMLGHLSAFHLNLMNFPEEMIDSDVSAKLDQHDEVRLRRLLPKLVGEKSSNLLLLNTKIEDAIRRDRKFAINDGSEGMRIAIDQLLDYCQILEAILPTQGVDFFALYAARLLKEFAPGQFGDDSYANYEFIRKIYKARNDVMHGRIDHVLTKKTISQHDVGLFGRMIHFLASLYVMNGRLNDSATKLSLGEPATIQSLYPPTPEKRVRPQHALLPTW